MPSLTPTLSSTISNPNTAFNNSWISVENDQDRTIYAQAIYNVNDSVALGQKGATFLSSTKNQTGSWHTIQVLTDARFTELKSEWDGDKVSDEDIFLAGTMIYGLFTSITLASGKIIAYKN